MDYDKNYDKINRNLEKIHSDLDNIGCFFIVLVIVAIFIFFKI